MTTSFWRDKWVGSNPLCVTFSRLFSISNQKDAWVGDVCEIRDEESRWTLTWQRPMFLWEGDLLQNLLALVASFCWSGVEDSWRREPEDECFFSVKSCYTLLQSLCLLEVGVSDEEEIVFENLWKSLTPSKVVAFSWTLLLDKVPTRANLAKRRILGEDVSTRKILLLFSGGAFHGMGWGTTH